MKINLFVQQRPHMRDSNLEYYLHMGTVVLKQIFDEERVDTNIKTLELFYPERWLNIVEEQSLFRRLEKFCPNLESVTIITQSVNLICMCKKEDIRILSSEDQIKRSEYGLTQASVTGRLWYKNVLNFYK